MSNPATVDRVFHALGDPTRRALVERLSLGPASVTELARPHDLTLAAVMQHLQFLEQSGLVTSDKAGRVRTCRLAPEGLAVADRWIAERRSRWERRLDRLAQVLDEPTVGPRPRPRQKRKGSTP